jgi:hypothetical protein
MSEDAIAAASTTINLQWNANPEEEQVTSYEVSIGISPGVYSSTYIASTPSYSVGLADGLYYASVKARNVKGLSPASGEISFRIGQPQFSLVIQRASTNGQTWTTNTTITSTLYDPSPKRFWRMKLTDTQAIVETSTDLINWSTLQTIASTGANTRLWRINLNKL